MSVKEVSIGKIRDVAYIEWDIEKYVQLSAGKKGEFHFTSPSFEILGATWNLHLYPNFKVRCYAPGRFESYYYVSIFLEKESSEVDDHYMLYKLEMKAGERIMGSFSEKVCFKNNSRYGTKTFLDITDPSRKIELGDTVTVILHVYPTDSTIQKVKCQTDFAADTSEGVNVLSTDMKNLYLNQEDCDFTIRVKTQEFKVHKAILAVRSPVLYSMLHHDMAEQKTGIVDIVDFEPDVFENFILHLYTGRVDDLSWENVTQLYMLGDKYDLQFLKNICRKYMLHQICMDMFYDVVVLAVKYNEQTLLKCVEDYFLKNAKSILSSKQWQEFLLENPTVCNEFFLKYVSRFPSDSE